MPTGIDGGRRPGLVVSHERSGTHFTMNAMARAFGYESWPWFDFDRPRVNINYFAAENMRQALRQIAERRVTNVVKSHHEFDFFRAVIDEAASRFHLVYVYRNPADALASFWRMVPTLISVEGPCCETALEFATAAPAAGLMRYQYRQYPTMLDRWANHVQGWVDVAEGRENIHLVRYEDLASDYAQSLMRLGRRVGMSPVDLRPPSRTERVISGGPLPFDPPACADNRSAVLEIAQSAYPELMMRLGYGARQTVQAQ